MRSTSFFYACFVLFLFLFLFLSPLSGSAIGSRLAFADDAIVLTPVHVGDRSNYSQESLSGTTTTSTGKMVQEITAYDAVKKSFTVKTTTTPVSGPQSVDTQQSTADELGSQDGLLKNCTTLGGTTETLKVGTVSVPTCKVTVGADKEDDETTVVWFGSVPFSLVRSETTVGAGKKTIVILDSFVFGAGAPAPTTLLGVAKK